MKKILTICLLLSGLTVLAQTKVEIDLSNLTSDITIGLSCGTSVNNPTKHYITKESGNNLNGFTVFLRNSTIQFKGDLLGYGKISACDTSSTRCVEGNTSPNITFHYAREDCQSLSTPNNEINISDIIDSKNKTITLDNSLYLHVYDISGKMVLKTKEDVLSYSNLSSGFYILKSDIYRGKFYIK